MTLRRRVRIVAAMVGLFSRRLLAVLQFTRLALVFTAISNAWAAMLLEAGARAGPGREWSSAFDPAAAVFMTLVSIGLYGFGMSLNDVIDRRRDATIAADRPLPSGRLPVAVGKAICAALLFVAGAGGALLSRTRPTPHLSAMTLALTAGVALLIVGYDFIGKYLLSLGLLSLGLIRFFHATIADPTISVPWHPLLMLNHVTLLSSVAYVWEQKRPAFTKRHVAAVLGGLLAINGSFIGLLAWRRVDDRSTFAADLAITPALWWPALAIVAFGFVALAIRRRHADSRGAGKMLMLVGLLWLIVYDAAFVAGHVDVLPALGVLALLPLAWFSVKLMRAWSMLVALSERPRYLRV